MRRIGLIVALLLPALAPFPAFAATEAGAILRGIVSTAQAPVGAGAIRLYDGTKLVQSEPYQIMYNGTFAVTLNEAAASALSAGVLRIDVDVDQTTTLIADLGMFDPATQVIFINPVTTIEAAYRNLKPATAVATADGAVSEALGVGSPAATACGSITGFNGPMVSSESVASGGFNAYVQSVAQQIAQGRTPGLRSVRAVPQDFRDFFLETAGDIFGEALGGFPGVKPLAGWILGQVYSAPNETPEQLQEIKGQLSNISSQLNQVLAGISRLSDQIKGLEQTVIDQNRVNNYEQDARDAQQHINSLCNIQKQLIVLARADPSQNNTSFAATLQQEIQANVGLDLLDMWEDLEGTDSIGTRSLIKEWANLIGPDPGSPTFANVSYLASAVPNLQYYQGAMLVGYNLQVELGHAEELQGATDIGKQLIIGASSDFEQHDDTEMKLLAHKQEVGGSGSGLYAAVLPPFFAAAKQVDPKSRNARNEDPTNAYNWTIDTRTMLMWMERRSCDGENCTFAMYDQEGGVGSGVSLVQPYLSKINGMLNSSYPGELFAMTAPSRAQWANLLVTNHPCSWLAPQNILPCSQDHFWTSDVKSEAPGPRLFPAWNNWLVDTYAKAFGYGEPTENLELVSPAPLTDPYHFLYRSHQDDFSMNVFTSGPSMGVARDGATVTPLLNGKVLIAGGLGANNQVLRSTELYDPTTGSFVGGPSMNTPRVAATATLLPNGKVLIAGGRADYNNGVLLKSTELYDPATNTFAAANATASMNTERESATATPLPDGKVLIVGGVNGFLTTIGTTELYDPYANTFAPANFTASMKISRSGQTATLLPNGKVLIAGGSGATRPGAPDQTLGSTDLYDPATNTFAAGPAMTAARISATATLLPNGKVLIAGGLTGPVSGPLNSTELYDPATNTFAAGPSMNSAHGGAMALLLPNGKVLIVGGLGAGTSTELYDPATNAFVAGNPMTSARSDTTAVVLPDSQVLIPGGSVGGGPSSTTVLYTE